MRKSKILTLLLLASPWVSVNAVESNNTDSNQSIEKIVLQKKSAEKIQQQTLDRLGKDTIDLARKGDLEAVKTIFSLLSHRAFGIHNNNPEFINNLFQYLVLSAVNGKTKTVEFLLNYNEDECKLNDDLGCLFDKNNMDKILSIPKIAAYEYISDLISIVRHDDKLLGENMGEKTLSQTALLAWERVLNNKDAHIGPQLVGQFFSDVVTLEGEGMNFLAKKMLQNYVDGLNNAPDERTISWLVPMPNSAEYTATDAPQNDSFEEWIKERPSRLDERYEDFSDQWHRDQWNRRNTFIKALIQEKPAQGETENLYQKVCKKLMQKTLC